MRELCQKPAAAATVGVGQSVAGLQRPNALRPGNMRTELVQAHPFMPHCGAKQGLESENTA
jgi:hypothetical protein